jgi:hypothetical protein
MQFEPAHIARPLLVPISILLMSLTTNTGKWYMPRSLYLWNIPQIPKNPIRGSTEEFICAFL